MGFLSDVLSNYKNTILLLSFLSVTTTSLLLIFILRLAQILPAPIPISSTPQSTSAELTRPPPSETHPTHLLIVLGSGGHTTEMLNILSSSPILNLFTQRTYVVSSGDSFSTGKAAEFEKGLQGVKGTYSIVTVRRARRVHQSFLSTPITTLFSLWDCVAVLMGTHQDLNMKRGQKFEYPDLILTNGPGTGVCVVVAALLLRFFGYGGSSSYDTTPLITQSQRASEGSFMQHGQMRTIFIESWARVKTLSLSGRILRPLVNRFLVQWPQLAEMLGDGVEYIGPLVS